MPRRNIIRSDAPDSFYHVYARGHSRKRIFRDEQDYLYFMKLLERYLAPEDIKGRNRHAYPNFYGKVELNAYCLMTNHFHLLVYQYRVGELTALMRSLMTSYSIYFNKKYRLSGALFESRFRASLITDDAYLEHITRYIHLNPRQWRSYEYSSLPYYLQQVEVSWLRPDRVLKLFPTPSAYMNFLEDYEDNKRMMDILKHELAG